MQNNVYSVCENRLTIIDLNSFVHHIYRLKSEDETCLNLCTLYESIELHMVRNLFANMFIGFQKDAEVGVHWYCTAVGTHKRRLVWEKSRFYPRIFLTISMILMIRIYCPTHMAWKTRRTFNCNALYANMISLQRFNIEFDS